MILNISVLFELPLSLRSAKTTTRLLGKKKRPGSSVVCEKIKNKKKLFIGDCNQVNGPLNYRTKTLDSTFNHILKYQLLYIHEGRWLSY